MHCKEANTFAKQETKTKYPGLIRSRTKALVVSTFNCDRGSHAARMDDCDDSERSLDV